MAGRNFFSLDFFLWQCDLDFFPSAASGLLRDFTIFFSNDPRVLPSSSAGAFGHSSSSASALAAFVFAIFVLSSLRLRLCDLIQSNIRMITNKNTMASASANLLSSLRGLQSCLVATGKLAYIFFSLSPYGMIITKNVGARLIRSIKVLLTTHISLSLHD
ncbi:hypothetical protein M441DRAFT_48522 [Trichoderma asperellum CBS 433.97]|uniref:Uncharacterized protein n=1 Tax=Trichoderma asperellum (strain ATCC 204424 / CBS 433.97 / NBRC 101777) TaxID=1042311 RepID=A0A2T3Z3H4_TRIA4|nr:hypothetical protein M441DRAFT_48522 [Trichoderma asperellum CBS 433.97]PTB39342.1 hypothetical protein M441DRAFT_48522 [Trichoderma asperellum CBS 433.97]